MGTSQGMVVHAILQAAPVCTTGLFSPDLYLCFLKSLEIPDRDNHTPHHSVLETS